MSVVFKIYLGVMAFAVLAELADIAKSLLKIAVKIDLRESNWAKGYERGYADAERYYGIYEDDEDGDT